MPGFQAILSTIEMGQETTWGTAVATQAALNIESADMTETQKWEDVADMHAGAAGATRRRVLTRIEAGGSVTVKPSYQALGILLQAAIGSNSSAGAGPYTHTITSLAAASCPAFTARFRVGNSSYIKTYSGCKVSKLSCEWTGGQMGKLTATLIAQKMGSFASGSPTTPTVILDVLPKHMATGLVWDSVTYSDVPMVRLEVDNKFEQLWSVGNAYTTEPMPGGDARKMIRVTASLRITAAVYDTLEGKYASGTTSNLTFRFTGSGNNYWDFTVHNAQVVELKHSTQGAGTQTVSVTWAATDDGTGNDGITLVQANDNANFYA